MVVVEEGTVKVEEVLAAEVVVHMQPANAPHIPEGSSTRRNEGELGR